MSQQGEGDGRWDPASRSHQGSNEIATPRYRSIAWGVAAAAVLLIAIAGILIRAPHRQPSVVHVMSPIARTATFTVSLDSSRPATPVRLVLPRDTSLLLQIRLNPRDHHDSYAVELRSQNATWRADHLRASNRKGDLSVSAFVPAAELPAGSCELEVRGGGDGLGIVTLDVQRTP